MGVRDPRSAKIPNTSVAIGIMNSERLHSRQSLATKQNFKLQACAPILKKVTSVEAAWSYIINLGTCILQGHQLRFQNYETYVVVRFQSYLGSINERRQHHPPGF